MNVVSRRRFLGATFACGCVVIPAIGRAQSLKPVRFGSVGGLTDAGLYIADEMGFFRDAGLSVAMNRMAEGSALATSLASGQLDVAGISVAPAVFAAIQQGLDIRIVGDKQSYKPGMSATQFVVRTPLVKKSKRETILGLKGKLIGVSSTKSVAFMQVENLLQMNGVDPSGVRYVELRYPEMTLALQKGSIDAAQIIEPFLTEAVENKSSAIVSDMIEARGSIGMNTTVPLIYSEKFADDHGEGLAFMIAYMRGVRAYIDAVEKNKGRDRVYAILSRRTNLPVALIARMHLPYLDPNQKIDPAAFDAMQDYYLKKKWLRSRVDISKLVDTSFAREAVEKLGPYA